MPKGANWDLTSYFKHFNSPEMLQFKDNVQQLLRELLKKASNAPTLTNDNQALIEQIFLDYQELSKLLSHYASYCVCLTSLESNNELYSKEYANFCKISSEFGKIESGLKMILKNSHDKAFSKFCNRNKLKKIKYYISTIREEAKKTMSTELENLAAELNVDGFSSWDRLYSRTSGKLSFFMHWPDGVIEKTPIAQCRLLMQVPDREIRKAAFEYGNIAWEKVEDVCAAALNAISGNRLTLNKHRGYDHFLDVSLRQSRVTHKSINALFKAIDNAKPFIQKILKAKAKAMNLKKLAWFDCEAPLIIPEIKNYTWNEGVKMLDQAFAKTYPDLRFFFKKAIENNWIESMPRDNKNPGAFCTSSILTGESRVFMTYSGTLSSLLNLAHEVGHAFHSAQLSGLPPLAQDYPMTLAESASTFAEILFSEGILASPNISKQQKLSVLTSTINHTIAFLVDIPIRFTFEQAFYNLRHESEVTVSELKSLMIDAMHKHFGSILAEDGADPMFWASKMHFYLTGITFYNYPYTFGYLLSRGLYRLYKNEGKSFLPKYEQFLRLSGSGSAIEIAKQVLGINLETVKFWEESILSHTEELTQFEKLAKELL